MGCSKGNSKRKFYLRKKYNIILPQQKRKIENNLTLYLKATRKKKKKNKQKTKVVKGRKS